MSKVVKRRQAKSVELVNELYVEFSALIRRGYTIRGALEQFNYLHPITYARLEKRVWEIYPTKITA